jgi:DNA-binding transcriptional ArsR family regulator
MNVSVAPRLPDDPQQAVRKLDLASLKALAHPLRVQILETLSRYGAQTACGLAELLDESSGSTSYHLRQLAKHDFVHEVEGKGTARERWWERSAGYIQIASPEFSDDPMSSEAQRLISREFEHNRATALADYMNCDPQRLPPEWRDAGAITTSNIRLTAEQLNELSAELEAVARRIISELRAEGEHEGARPVQIHLNAFPLVSSLTAAPTATPAAARTPHLIPTTPAKDI